MMQLPPPFEYVQRDAGDVRCIDCDEPTKDYLIDLHNCDA